jgi:hypothetical protein
MIVLNQLGNRHQVFGKLLFAESECHLIPHAQLHLQMNSIDVELEQFMKRFEWECHSLRGIASSGPHMLVCGYTRGGCCFGSGLTRRVKQGILEIKDSRLMSEVSCKMNSMFVKLISATFSGPVQCIA